MVRDILESAAMGKLRGILSDRYGKGLRVSFMQDVSSLEIEEDGYILARGDLHIPIQVNEKYLATAIVEKGGDLGIAEIETVSQLVRLFLEPEVFSWYVQQATHNSKIEITKDVISIFEPFDLKPELPPSAGTNVLCLAAKNPHLIRRTADNVHQITQRWAFLRFEDIQKDISKPEDLQTLGALTLLIDDILKLSSEQQELIHKVVSRGSPADEPLILIGCTSSIEELESRQMIHPGLAKLLKIHRLEIERLPRDPKLLQESLEIMLEF